MINKYLIAQRIVQSIKSNSYSSDEQSINTFANDLADIIADAIQSATITIQPAGINPANTSCLAGAFPGTVTNTAPITLITIQ